MQVSELDSRLVYRAISGTARATPKNPVLKTIKNLFYVSTYEFTYSCVCLYTNTYIHSHMYVSTHAKFLYVTVSQL